MSEIPVILPKGRVKLEWTCDICNSTATRKTNMIRHITTIHGITDNVKNNFTGRVKGINGTPSSSIQTIDVIKNHTIDAVIPASDKILEAGLIDMTDKSVQIEAQLRDIYTYIDQIDDLGNEFVDHARTIDAHDDKLTELENEVKVCSEAVEIIASDNSKFDTRFRELENMNEILRDEIGTLMGMIRKLQNEVNKLTDANKTI